MVENCEGRQSFALSDRECEKDTDQKLGIICYPALSRSLALSFSARRRPETRPFQVWFGLGEAGSLTSLFCPGQWYFLFFVFFIFYFLVGEGLAFSLAISGASKGYKPLIRHLDRSKLAPNVNPSRSPWTKALDLQ